MSLNEFKFYACMLFLLSVVASVINISLALAIMNIGLIFYVLSSKK